MGVIVVATDGSNAASAALDQALSLARGTGDTVAVITAWRALQGDFGLSWPTTVGLGTLLEEERRHAERTLEDAVGRGAEAGVPVETRLATGDPAECVCAFAREHDARLIAMGSHGYGLVRSIVTGSVSSAVLREAGCPVLVVPEPSLRADSPRHRRSRSVAGTRSARGSATTARETTVPHPTKGTQ